MGLMESHQKLFFLPEAHTDFIFAVMCEELGFIGAAIVLSLFAVYGWRGFVAAIKAPDEFGGFWRSESRPWWSARRSSI